MAAELGPDDIKPVEATVGPDQLTRGVRVGWIPVILLILGAPFSPHSSIVAPASVVARGIVPGTPVAAAVNGGRDQAGPAAGGPAALSWIDACCADGHGVHRRKLWLVCSAAAAAPRFSQSK